MDRDTALRIFSELDERFAWSEEEHKQGVKEAKQEGEDPLERPHAFNVRLDSKGDPRDFGQEYRLRVTTGIYATTREDWQRVFDLAREHDITFDFQNSGVELF